MTMVSLLLLELATKSVECNCSVRSINDVFLGVPFPTTVAIFVVLSQVSNMAMLLMAHFVISIAGPGFTATVLLDSTIDVLP